MANPSLQIGDSNWAIKEDNLLGYSTAGTRFVPQPITMTRASLGSRVNPSGLVEDVELLGSENIDLTTGSTIDASSWGSVTTSGATYLAGGNNPSYHDTGFVVTSGLTYKLSFTISDYTGTATMGFSTTGGVSSNARLEGNGSYTEYFTASSSVELRIFGLISNAGVFSNISVKEYTASNLARVDYTDGTSSLLVEPQRTNLVTNSSDFSGWSKLGSTEVTPDTTISPDGTLNADSFTFTTSTSDKIQQTVTVVASQQYTVSCYIKSDSNITIKMGGAAASTPINVTTEWVRHTVTQTNGAGTTAYPQLTSNGTAGTVYVYGFQLEQGSYPTSYIPTSGSTVTRNQETYTKTGISDKINSEEGVLFVEIAGLVDADTYDRVISLSDNSTTNRVEMKLSSGGSIKGRFDSASSDITLAETGLTASNFNKIALVWSSGKCALFINGVKEQEDLTFNTFASDVLFDLSFDSAYLGGSSNFYGKVKQLQVYKTALSDPELVTLTT